MLAAADAVVVLRNAAETRRVPFTAFYTGYRQSVRRPDELIVGFEIPAIHGRQWFRKVGTRAAQAISKVVIAGVAPAGRTGSVRVATIEDAQRTLLEEIAPIDDIRSTADYRRRVAANLLARFWTDAHRR